MAKKRKKSRGGLGGVSFIEMAVIIAVALILIIFLVTQSRALEQKNKEYAYKISNLEKDIEKENERKDEIAELESEINTPEYAGKYAKDHWGLVGEDEIIFRPEQ